jgi:hypothetical protein
MHIITIFWVIKVMNLEQLRLLNQFFLEMEMDLTIFLKGMDWTILGLVMDLTVFEMELDLTI